MTAAHLNYAIKIIHVLCLQILSVACQKILRLFSIFQNLLVVLKSAISDRKAKIK